jgi:DNA replication and repair protein RecF
LRLLSLRLRNYRNYARLELAPASGLNVFLGSNGQGKTNLLESMALVALSASPRARREVELIGPLAAAADLEALVESHQRRTEVAITVSRQGEHASRRIRVDGVARRAVDLPGILRVTLFWPEDLNLIKAGPEHRRRLLNQVLVQIEPGYARTLSRYGRILEQRNQLLKQVAAGTQPRSALELWDSQLCEFGGELVGARARLVEELEPVAAAMHREISAGEELALRYLGPAENLEQAVENSVAEDLRRGLTTVGPHRDDVGVQLNGVDARGYASQGQQRTAVISLKLAEAILTESRTGEKPLLLLDDVLSELDAGRRRALLERVGGRDMAQVIITSVDAEAFPASLMAAADVRCIVAGTVTACG